MTLSLVIRKPVPGNCGGCEFSIPLGDEHTLKMVMCVRNATHHNANQGLCAWYARAGYLDLSLEIATVIPNWMKALAIRDLPDVSNLEAIVNILRDRVGPELAKPAGDAHEK